MGFHVKDGEKQRIQRGLNYCGSALFSDSTTVLSKSGGKRKLERKTFRHGESGNYYVVSVACRVPIWIRVNSRTAALRVPRTIASFLQRTAGTEGSDWFLSCY